MRRALQSDPEYPWTLEKWKGRQTEGLGDDSQKGVGWSSKVRLRLRRDPASGTAVDGLVLVEIAEMAQQEVEEG